MERFPSSDPELNRTLASVVLGFLGVSALIMLLPKTLKFMVRRFVLGLIGEIVAVVITGLLTEKVVSWIGHDNEATNGQVRPAAPRRSTPTMP